MGQPAESHEPASLSDADLAALLERLAEEERLVSMQRRRLHERIDGPTRNGSHTQLTTDVQQERALSERRLQLHGQITKLRVERSRRLARSHLGRVK